MSSFVDTNNAHWIVQILFGRYRSLGAIQYTHLAVLGVVGVVMINVYLFFLKRKFSAYARQLESLPRISLPLSRSILGAHTYRHMVGELARVDALLSPSSPRLEPEVASGGDSGWKSEGHFDVHFSTSIAKSFLLLEKTALSRRPGLKHTQFRTVREYIAALKKAFPSLRDDVVLRNYVHTYERAVFGKEKCTLDDFNRFQSVVEAIVSVINEKSFASNPNSQAAFNNNTLPLTQPSSSSSTFTNNNNNHNNNPDNPVLFHTDVAPSISSSLNNLTPPPAAGPSASAAAAQLNATTIEEHDSALDDMHPASFNHHIKRTQSSRI